MATSPKIAPAIHERETVLAWRTKPGGESIKGGETKNLATIDTAGFDKIRLVCDERVGSTCNVQVRLTFMEGAELVAFLDTLMLTPHAQATRVFDIPGTKLEVAIDAVGAPPTQGTVDVLIYGQY
jgi:hypothetical protein